MNLSSSRRSETQETHETASGSAERSSLDLLREVTASNQPLTGRMPEQNPQHQRETLTRGNKLPPREAETWENIVETEAWKSKEVQDVIKQLKQEYPGSMKWNNLSAEIIVEYQEQIENINAKREEGGENSFNVIAHLDAIKRALENNGSIYIEVAETTSQRRSESEEPRAARADPFSLENREASREIWLRYRESRRAARTESFLLENRESRRAARTESFLLENRETRRVSQLRYREARRAARTDPFSLENREIRRVSQLRDREASRVSWLRDREALRAALTRYGEDEFGPLSPGEWI